MKLTSLNQLPIAYVSHNPEIQKQVMLRSGDLPHLTNFSQARFAPGQISSVHEIINDGDRELILTYFGIQG
jgi:hypothetical protein